MRISMPKPQLILVAVSLLVPMAVAGPIWGQPVGPNGAAARCRDGTLVFVMTSAACRWRRDSARRDATPYGRRPTDSDQAQAARPAVIAAEWGFEPKQGG